MAAIRQKCNEKNGCFMENNHPKVEDFEGDFGTNPPRDIQFTDIDSVVEVDGYFLFLEFKDRDDLEKGQDICYRALTRLEAGDKCAVLHVYGRAAHREAIMYRECLNGKWGGWVDCSWQSLRDKIQNFVPEAKARYRARLAKNPPAKPYA